MQLEDYRRLSDDGLAHVTMLEQRCSQLLADVAHLRAALAEKVDTNPAAAPIDHAILNALRADLEAARADIEQLQTIAHREQLRAKMLFKSLNACVDSMADVSDCDINGDWGRRFERNETEARELLKTAAPYMT